MLEVLLKRFGHEPILVSDGEAALEALRRDREISVALLDWMMPKMDGVDVCRAARKEPALQDRYLILVTGRTEEADVTSAMEAGANDYLIKPIDVADLRERLERAVGGPGS